MIGTMADTDSLGLAGIVPTSSVNPPSLAYPTQPTYGSLSTLRSSTQEESNGPHRLPNAIVDIAC